MKKVRSLYILRRYALAATLVKSSIKEFDIVTPDPVLTTEMYCCRVLIVAVLVLAGGFFAGNFFFFLKNENSF